MISFVVICPEKRKHDETLISESHSAYVIAAKWFIWNRQNAIVFGLTGETCVFR